MEKIGSITRADVNKQHKVSKWVLEKAKKRERETEKRHFKADIKGKEFVISFSGNAEEKLVYFCEVKGLDLSIFEEIFCT